MTAARLRVTPVVLFALGASVVITWSLRDNARFLPKELVSRHALAQMGEHPMGYVPPAPVTGSALVNYPGLIMLAVHLTAVIVAAAAWVIRRSHRNVHSVPARLLFAVSVSLAAAVVTLPIAAVSLGTAILFSATVTAAMTVLQYTFVLTVAGVTIFGVP
jgi:hypothetical protein